MDLGALLDELRAAGIDAGADIPATLGVARELKILQIPDGGSARFLRIVERQKGERDFANLSYLSSKLGERVNAPSTVVTAGDLACGVFPFVAHEKLSYGRLNSCAGLREIGEILVLMHEAGRGLAAPPCELEASRVYGDVVVDATLRAIASMKSAVAQHCDFTYANLGIDTRGRIVVFDWEDFGAVTYPAFDFTTFILGHYHFADAIAEIADSPAALIERIDRDFGKEFLARLDFSSPEYLCAFPAYLALFMGLKKGGFGAAINARLRGIWQRLQRSPAWERYLSTTIATA